jgi:D-2-hydroxyglutarate dehydrogenase
MRTSAARVISKCTLNHLSQAHLRNISRVCEVVEARDSKYLNEWFGRAGSATSVCVPRSIEELRNVLKYCNAEKVGVTVFGGNTGLVGGSLSGKGELIVTIEKLNRIINIDHDSSVATVESGVILENLQSALAPHGLTTPYDLGARGSCLIGGNLATNAGGVNFIRNGPLRGHVIGLEAVLADGSVFDAMSSCWKDNTGLDIKQLMIGSEGSLGVITKVRLHCPNLPKYKAVAVFHSPKPFEDSVLRFLRMAKMHVGESLSAFEFIDSEGCGLIDNLPFTVSPGGFTVLIEAASAMQIDDRLEALVAALGEEAQCGFIASDETGMKKLWNMRERLPVSMALIGPNLKYDVSLPHKVYYNLVDLVRLKFGRSSHVQKIVGYGHVGDGNLHLNIALAPDTPATIRNEISDFVYSTVQEMNGSISAEHGIGRDKLSKLREVKSPLFIDLSRQIKRLFDPHGILNPGRTVPF